MVIGRGMRCRMRMIMSCEWSCPHAGKGPILHSRVGDLSEL